MTSKLLLSILIIPCAIAQSAQNDMIRVVHDTSTELVLVADWSGIDITRDSENFLQIDGPGLSDPMAFSFPQLKGIPVHIAVPPDGDYELHVDTEGITSYSGRARAVSDSTRQMGFRSVPDTWAAVYSDGMLRHARIIEIWLFPALCRPDGSGFRSADRLTVSVSFTGGAGGVQHYRTDSFKSVYKTILNSRTARSWRRTPRPSHLRPNRLPEYAVKAYIRDQGLCIIPGEDFEDIGVSLDDIDPATFRIMNRGVDIPFFIRENGNGFFDAGDTLFFFAVPNYRPDPGCRLMPWWDQYTKENVYWISWGEDPGTRFVERSAAVSGTAEVVDWHVAIAHSEQDNEPFLSETDAPKPIEWFWIRWGAGANSTSKQFPITLNNPLSTGSIPRLRAGLHGYTNIDNEYTQHHTGFSLNGTAVGDTVWGLGNGRVELCYDSMEHGDAFLLEWLQDGENTVKVQAFNDTDAGNRSTSYFNFCEIEYPRSLTAVSDTLLFSIPDAAGTGTRELRIDGIESDEFVVLDLARGEILTDGSISSGVLSFETEIGDSSLFYICSENRFITPARLVREYPAEPPLGSGAGQATYLVVSYDRQSTGDTDPLHNIFPAAADLALARQDSVETRLIDVQDIYDEFNHGILHPEAIRDFFHFAFEEWTETPLEAVLLFGDGSWDYHQQSDVDATFPFIPCYDYPPSENFYAELTMSGDEYDVFPDIHIGRMPVLDALQADNAKDKLLGYSEVYGSDDIAGDDWRKHAVMVVGGFNESEQATFQYHSELLLDDFWLSSPFLGDTERIYRSLEGYQEGYYNRRIVEAINDGCMLVNYIGHGAALTWGVMLDVVDFEGLENGMKLPVSLGLTCNSGAFAEPDTGSLGEAFLRLDDIENGAIAFWGASAKTSESQAYNGSRNFLDGLCIDLERKLGPLSTAGKVAAGTAYLELFVLLGDPMTSLGIPTSPDLSVSADSILIDPFPVGEDQDVTVRIIAENDGRGDTRLVRTRFQAGKPEELQTIASVLDSSGSRRRTEYAIPWNTGMGLGDRDLLCTVDADMTLIEHDETNNVAERRIDVLISPPELSIPFDNQVVSSRSPNLTIVNISEESGSVSYLFHISGSDTFETVDPDFQSSGIIPQSETITSWSPSTLHQGSTYYWRCRADDNEFEGAWSRTRSFLVDTTITSIVWDQRDGGQFSRDSLSSVIVDHALNHVQLESGINPLDFAHIDQGASVVSVSSQNQDTDPQNLIGASIGGITAAYYGQFLFLNNDYDQQAVIDLGQERMIGITGSEHWIGSDDRPVWESYRITTWTDDDPQGIVWGSLGPFTEPALENITTPLFFSMDTPRAVRYMQFDFGAGLPHPWPDGNPWGSRIYELFAFAVDFVQSGTIVTNPIGPASHWDSLMWDSDDPGESRIRFSILSSETADGLYEPVEGLTDLNETPAELDAVSDPYIRVSGRLETDDPTTTPRIESWSIEFTSAVDLAFSDSISMNPGLPVPGTTATISSVLRNAAAVTARDIQVSLNSISGDTSIAVWDSTLGTLFPGSHVLISAPWLVEEGVFTLNLIAEPGGGAEDVAPADNSRGISIRILPDPAFLDSFVVQTDNPQVGDPVTFRSWLSNAGPVTSDSLSWMLSVKSETDDSCYVVDTGFVQPIPPFQRAEITAEWDSPVSSGIYVAELAYVPVPGEEQISVENDTTRIEIRVLSAADFAARPGGFSNPYPPAGDPVSVRFRVANNGEVPAESLAVDLYHRAPETTETLLASWGNIAVGGLDSIRVDTEFQTLGKTGIHVFRLEVDPDNSVSEVNESDNTAIDSILVQDGVDLSILEDSLSVEDSIIIVGDTLKADATVRNAGVAAVDSFWVSWRSDGLSPLDSVRTVLPGTSGVTLTGRFVATQPGDDIVLTLILDAPDEIDETNEENNSSNSSVIVLGEPDLSIRNQEIRFEPSAPTEDDTVLIKYVIRNIGGSSSDQFSTEILHRVSGVEEWDNLGVFEEPALEAGALAEREYTWIAEDPEFTHWFRIIANPDSSIREAEYSNNNGERSLLISPRDNSPPSVSLWIPLAGFADSAWVPEIVPFSGSVTDSGSGIDTTTISIRLDGDPVTLSNISWTMPEDSTWRIRGTVGPLEPGFHELTLAIDDNVGNPGISRDIPFRVGMENRPVSLVIMNRPERDETVFVIRNALSEHARLTVYTVSGRAIRSWSVDVVPPETHIPWDRRDEDGDRVANGVYLCAYRGESTGTIRRSYALIR